MAAQYTEVTLEDMERFLKRGFRALRPKQGIKSGEYYYDLSLSPHVIIRVWTSVGKHSATGAGVGQDAIRIQFLSGRTQIPMVSGKAPIVKRTQGWRNSLQGKIEDLIEAYEEKADYWDSRGQADMPVRTPGAGPSDKQVGYLRFLMMRADANMLEASGVFETYRDLKWPFDEQNIRSMPSRQVSLLIDRVKSLVGSRYAADAPLGLE